MFRPGFYTDWLGDLVIVYPDDTFEYWGDVSGYRENQHFYLSKDLMLLEDFGVEFIAAL